MTNEEAVKILKAIYFLDEKKQETLDMAIEALENNDKLAEDLQSCLEMSKKKKAEVEALKRKRGEWIESDFGWKCSICGNTSVMWQRIYNFCPNCGADMRKILPKP